MSKELNTKMLQCNLPTISRDNMRKTLHCKKAYSPSTKVAGWERYGNTLPIDNDPYCQEGYKLHLSHYNRLGWQDDVEWTTSTKKAMQKHWTRTENYLNPIKTLVNLYTDINDDCSLTEGLCSATQEIDYLTTMQQSYQPPYSFELKRLSMAVTPYFQNKFLTQSGVCKFQDDDYVLQTQRLQNHKSARYVSYNPCTNMFSDGSLNVIRKPKCTVLRF